MDILLPSLFGLHCILGPAGVLPNMSLLESLADHANIDIWSMVPSLVDELGETPDVLAKFKSSKFICASGGGYILCAFRLDNDSTDSAAFKVQSARSVLAKSTK